MAWILVDDLTGEHVHADRAARLQLFLDNGGNGDDDVRLLGQWDVDGERPDDGIRADLGEHLTRNTERPLDPCPLDEPAEDAPAAAQPTEPASVTTSDESLDSTYSVGPVEVGEADRGTATDAQVRAWNELHELGDLRSRRRIPAWLREQYERLDGGEPDVAARRVAARQTSTAGTSAADEDPPTPDRAGPPGRASGRSNGTRVPDFPSDSSTDDGTHYADDGCDPPHVEPEPAKPEPAKPEAPVRPVVEPIGDGEAQPPSTAKQLARADELAAEGATPRQICSDTGVWLSEARAAVRKATQR